MGGRLAKELTIVLWDDPILKKPCMDFQANEFSHRLLFLGEDMLKTIETTGLGLSGPQVGLSKNIFVMRLKSGDNLICINPKVTPRGDFQHHEEGCLSFPNIYGPVSRQVKCLLQYEEPVTGEWRDIELEGYDSFCAQHEYDHLQGIMFFERMPKHYKKKALKEWETLQKQKARHLPEIM